MSLFGIPFGCFQSTCALKQSRQAAADFICQNVLGQLLPRQITRKAAEGLFSTHSVVFSNLPAYTVGLASVTGMRKRKRIGERKDS